jgi:protein-S-isoprenylcysteine O-methyltransferase Ste14
VPGPRNREDLCEEHPRGDLGQIIFGTVFAILWGLDSFVLKLTTFPAAHVPLFVRVPVAVLLIGLALYLAVKGHRVVFGEVREPPSVISTGIFSYTRHPLYLSAILLYLGLVVLTLSVAAFILWVIIAVFYDRISAYEEVRLTERFGDEYEDYTEQVPRWLPRPGGFGKD